MLFLRYQKPLIDAYILPKTQESVHHSDERTVLAVYLLVFCQVFISQANVQHTYLQGIAVRVDDIGGCADNTLYHHSQTVRVWPVRCVLGGFRLHACFCSPT